MSNGTKQGDLLGVSSPLFEMAASVVEKWVNLTKQVTAQHAAFKRLDTTAPERNNLASQLLSVTGQFIQCGEELSRLPTDPTDKAFFDRTLPVDMKRTIHTCATQLLEVYHDLNISSNRMAIGTLKWDKARDFYARLETIRSYTEDLSTRVKIDATRIDVDPDVNLTAADSDDESDFTPVTRRMKHHRRRPGGANANPSLSAGDVVPDVEVSSGTTFEPTRYIPDMGVFPAVYGRMLNGKPISKNAFGKLSAADAAKVTWAVREPEKFFVLEQADALMLRHLYETGLISTRTFKFYNEKADIVMGTEPGSLKWVTEDHFEATPEADEAKAKARFAYQAARAEHVVRQVAVGKAVWVAECFDRYWTVPLPAEARVEAARRLASFMQEDAKKGTLNKAFYMARLGILGAWRPNEEKSSLKARAWKSMVTLWGKDNAERLFGAFCDLFPTATRPKKTSGFVNLKSQAKKLASKSYAEATRHATAAAEAASRQAKPFWGVSWRHKADIVTSKASDARAKVKDCAWTALENTGLLLRRVFIATPVGEPPEPTWFTKFIGYSIDYSITAASAVFSWVTKLFVHPALP